MSEDDRPGEPRLSTTGQSTTAGALLESGVAYLSVGGVSQAVGAFELALARYTWLEDDLGRARCHEEMALARVKLGEIDRAEHHYREAFELYGAAGSVVGALRTARAIADLSAEAGRADDAIAFLRDSVVDGEPFSELSKEDQVEHLGCLGDLAELEFQAGNHAVAASVLLRMVGLVQGSACASDRRRTRAAGLR
jgi:tetratricopeptide (TPR) repeat protein